MKAKKREFVLAGIHRLYCTPYEVNATTHRLHWRPELAPKRGAKGCLCHTLKVTVNGEVV